MNPTDIFLLLLSLLVAFTSLAIQGWTINGIGPAVLASAGGFWQLWMQWLRHRSWLRHRESGFAPGTQHLALAATLGWFLAMVGAGVWLMANWKAKMDSKGSARLSYEDSCKLLQRLGYLDDGAVPPMPDHRPQYDDEEPLGVSFFRTFVGEGDLENLTLHRTFFGRSEVGPLSFKNTDLSESTLCWNDFNGVQFTGADLSGSDLRASQFNEVGFIRANLRGTDLRRSSFDECDFTDADMQGAKLTRKQGEELSLSDQQRKVIDWQDSDGDEPPGG